jgi:predicted branched-subunit amino acid permease
MNTGQPAPPAGRAGTAATREPEGLSWSWRQAARVAGKDLVPALVALAPLGLVVGVTVQQTGIGALLGVASAPAIYAGTAQLSALTLLHAGAGVVAVVGSVAVINARLVLYAAVLEPRFRGQPGWFRWLAPQFVVDPSFALVTARGDLDGPVTFRRYWLALGGLLTVAWTGLVALGVVVGPALSGAGRVLAFAPVAVFLSMVAPRLTDRPARVAAGVAGAVTGALALLGGLPAGVPVLVGAAAGVLAAMFTGGRTPTGGRPS